MDGSCMQATHGTSRLQLNCVEDHDRHWQGMQKGDHDLRANLVCKIRHRLEQPVISFPAHTALPHVSRYLNLCFDRVFQRKHRSDWSPDVERALQDDGWEVDCRAERNKRDQHEHEVRCVVYVVRLYPAPCAGGFCGSSACQGNQAECTDRAQRFDPQTALPCAKRLGGDLRLKVSTTPEGAP